MTGGISGLGPYYGYYGYGRNRAVEDRKQVQAAENTDAVPKMGKASAGQNRQMPVVQNRVPNGIPFLREGADPAEMAVRMRMQYSTDAGIEGVQKAFEKGECKTCEKRKYQDGSADPGVSFKTPAHIAPEQAASAVRGHEMEHVVRENAKAQREDRKVVSQSVTIHTAICPECGKAYVSGGTTRTTTASAAETQPETGAPGQEGRRAFSAVA